MDTDTVFTEKKTRTRVTGRFKKVGGILQNLSDMEMEGYEIHMGSTTLGEQTAAFTEITSFAGEEKGAAKADGVCHGNVYGTYVHGIFEKEEVVKAIVTAIGEAKGLDMTQIAGVDFANSKKSSTIFLQVHFANIWIFRVFMKLWKRGQMMKIELENVLPREIEKRSLN